MELADWLRVDAAKGRKPLFDQLRTQVIDGVREGALPPGTRLPTVRELESAAVVETRGRLGTFIARYDPTDAAMAAAAREYVQVARGLGLGKAEALRYIEAVPEDREAR